VKSPHSNSATRLIRKISASFSRVQSADERSVEISSPLKKEVFDLALSRVGYEFHQPSKTHIYYFLEIGPRGVKSFADFADRAFESFRENLRSIITTADEDQLRIWLGVIANSGHRSGIKSININPLRPQAAENALEINAALLNIVRLNTFEIDFVTSLVAENLKSLKGSIKHRWPAELKKEILDKTHQHDVTKHHRGDTQIVTLSKSVHTEMLLTAQRIGIDPRDLCQYLIVMGCQQTELSTDS
jgi:hypothetical protein